MTKMETIGQLVGKDPTKLMKSVKHMKEGEIKVVAPELIVGLELEIEGWRGHSEFTGFSFEVDNSLRNNGIEAITEPLRIKHVEYLLKNFYKNFNITDANYSERCSLHVHMNVCDMEVDHLASLALLYQVFERGLFTYVGMDRGNNIFCVPWCQANVNVNLVNTIRKQDWYNLKRWQKYTALNLLPILSRGSIEFRHMHGTCNVPRIMEWLNLIGSMYNYSIKTPVEKLQEVICELNTNSAYNAFLNDVFGEYSGVLTQQSEFQIAMEQGVIDCKLMLTKPEGFVNVKEPKGSRPTDNELERALAQLNAANARRAAAWEAGVQRFINIDNRPQVVATPARAAVNPIPVWTTGVNNFIVNDFDDLTQNP